MDSIIYSNANQHKCEDYAIDINDGNFENNLDPVIVSTGIKKNHINSGCIYSDIDNQRQNPTLQLLSVIANIKPTVSTTNQLISITIFYSNCG